MSQQHTSVPQGRICSDNCTCWHAEIEVADQTFYLNKSQYTDTGSVSPSTGPILSGAWSLEWLDPEKISRWYRSNSDDDSSGSDGGSGDGGGENSDNDTDMWYW